jgi:hypothetical protein
MEKIFTVSILPNGITKAGDFRLSARITLNPDNNIKSINEEELRVLVHKPLRNWIETFTKNALLTITAAATTKPVPLTESMLDATFFSGDMKAHRVTIYDRLFASSRNNRGYDDRPIFNYLPKAADLLDPEVSRKDLRSLLALRVKLETTNQPGVASTTVETIEEEVAALATPLDVLNKKFESIDGFAIQTNSRQYQQYAASGQVASPTPATPVDDATWIFEAFSHIGGNSVLQRIFGITIDFTIPAATLNGFDTPFDAKLTFGAIDLDAKLIVTPSSRMKVVRAEINKVNKKNLVLVSHCKEESLGLIFAPHELSIASYDKVGMLKSLQPFIQQMAELGRRVNHSELDRVRLVKERLKYVSTALTRGLNVYHADWIKNSIDCAQQILAKDDAILQAVTDDAVLREENLVKGHRFALVADRSATALGIRDCELHFFNEKTKNYDFQTAFEDDEFSITTDAGMLAVGGDAGNVSAQVDNSLLTWSGENIGMPSMFGVNEDHGVETPSDDEGSLAASTFTVLQRLQNVFTESYYPFKLVLDEMKDAKPLIKLEYYPVEKSNPKLLFGKPYAFIVKNSYVNGWAVPWTSTNEHELSLSDMVNLRKESSAFEIFKRNEPVRPVLMVAHEKLIEKDRITVPKDKAGESVTDLAIRSKQNDSSTSNTSSRHILPPQIAFEHAMWHNKIFPMDRHQSYSWYKKYHDPKSADDIRMPEFASQSKLVPNYLSDPLSSGFRLEFFLDESLTIRATEYDNQLEFYFSGDYPLKESFLLTLQDDDEDFNGTKIQLDGNKIVVKVRKGLTLYGVARTILDKKYEAELETYGNYNDYTRYGNNDILTPPQKFTLTHAVRVPLVTPRILNYTFNRRPENTTNVSFAFNIHFEQLHLHPDLAGVVRYITNTLPAGDLELLAKWEEYIDDPTQVLLGNMDGPDHPVIPLKDVKLKHETKVDLARQLGGLAFSLEKVGEEPNISKNFAGRVTVQYDTKSTPFLEKWYYVRNTSVFARYFPEVSGKDNFSLTSTEGMMVKVLNNKKPAPPAVNKIVPLIVKDEWGEDRNRYRVTRGNRLRIYLERGRLTSGKGERLAVMLNEPTAIYNEGLLNSDLLSMVGRDITSLNNNPHDGLYENERVLLQQSNFNTYDPYVIDEGGQDLEKFKPRYVQELGCMTYEPLFDRELNLWYCDIEMDINDKHGKELHCPMIQLMLAHYQENSENHNAFPGSMNPGTDLNRDCRLSEIIKSRFVYLLPSRILNVRHNASGAVTLSVQADEQSLKKGEGDVTRTAFYAAVQQSEDELRWETMDSKGKTVAKYHRVDLLMSEPLTLTYLSGSYGMSYRLLVTEAELFDSKEGTLWVEQANPFTDSNIEDHLGKRIVLIDLYNLE